jgi:1-acyl-sn-glycerol-3-phosphate acyltransferase
MSGEFIGNFSEAENPELYATSIRRTRRMLRFLWGLEVSNQEAVPQHGPAILAFVHRSYLDPWVIGASVPRAVRGMAKKQLQKKSYLGLGNVYLANRGIFFVDRENMAKESYETSVDVLRQEQILVIAPEGTHKNKGRLVGPTKFGVGRIATKAAAKGMTVPIIPAAIKTSGVHLREPVKVAFGQPLAYQGDTTTISQRREAAMQIDDLVRAELQRCYDEVLGLAGSGAEEPGFEMMADSAEPTDTI